MDCSGELEPEEIKKICVYLGFPVNDLEFSTVSNQNNLTHTQSGNISFQQFKYWFISHLDEGKGRGLMASALRTHIHVLRWHDKITQAISDCTETLQGEGKAIEGRLDLLPMEQVHGVAVLSFETKHVNLDEDSWMQENNLGLMFSLDINTESLSHSQTLINLLKPYEGFFAGSFDSPGFLPQFQVTQLQDRVLRLSAGLPEIAPMCQNLNELALERLLPVLRGADCTVREPFASPLV